MTKERRRPASWPGAVLREAAARLAGLVSCRLAAAILLLLAANAPAAAQSVSLLDEAGLARLVPPPFSLGERLDERGLHEILNSGGIRSGYAFQTMPRAPLPGFSGAPVNIFVAIDLEGVLLDVELIAHNEPIFVSGLGQAPFRAFFEQYRGSSIWDTMVIDTPYGAAEAGSGLVYLDGVTKATASIRIAHESILAAARDVAREYLQGVASLPAAFPDPDHAEPLDWPALVEQGIAARLMVTNAELEAMFAGTRLAGTDPEALAEPDALYADLWVVDVSPPAIAEAVLAPSTIAEMRRFQKVATADEFLLLVEAGRHGLVSDAFIRNTSPDWIAASQDGLPVALRDADFTVGLQPGLPQGVAMILRTDRRLGFDPARPFELTLKAVRQRGMLGAEIGSVDLTTTVATPERFFLRPVQPVMRPPWQEALIVRGVDLALLAGGLAALFLALGTRMNAIAERSRLMPARLAILAVMTVFVGWWGQGQLSIVTPLAVLRAAVDGGGLAFLLYDPFSLLVWAAAIVGFAIWGRALFCGWLCPFGALQEFAYRLGRLARLPEWEPTPAWDARLKTVKYVLLAGLVVVTFVSPSQLDAAVEIEPFKTAITVYFVREWYYVAYAAFWLVSGMVLFKGFCRYVCPLGAVMAIGGLLRRRDWIERRPQCGTPCQLCRVKCRYAAIGRSGRVDYSECFGCLDCVSIHDDPKRCVPLVLAARSKVLEVKA